MTLTDILCIVGIGITLIYDVYAYARWGFEATITATVQKSSKRWPLVPFLIGMLIGHWFW